MTPKTCNKKGCNAAAHAGLTILLAALPFQSRSTKAVAEVDFFLCLTHSAEFDLHADFLTDVAWEQLGAAFKKLGKMAPRKHFSSVEWRVIQ